MAKEINTQTIIFNPTAKTLDFSAWTSFDVRRLIAVTNNPKNVLIYSIANSGTGLSSINGNVITLQFDTSTHNASDSLTIMYDEEQGSTKALQVIGNSSLSSIASKDFASQTTLNLLNNKITNCNTEAVAITSSVLPTGASTSQLQTAGNNSLSSIDTKLPSLTAGKVPVETNLTPLTNTELRASAVPVSGTFWQATQPISGSVSVTNSSFGATQSTANNLLNKPCGYVTASPPVYASVTDQPLSLNINGGLRVDGSSVVQPVIVNPSSNIIGNIRIDQTTNGTTNKVYSDISQVNGASLSATNFLPSRITDGTSYINPTQIRTLTTADNISSTQSGTWNVGLNAGANTIGSIANTGFNATQSGTWNLNNISGTISLPTGASISALQETANTSLSSIDTKIPTKGQALIADSLPVVLPLSQITALTPPTTVNANITNLGQQTSNNSIPVVLANNQTALPIASKNYAQIVDDQTTFMYIGNSTVGSLASSSVWSIKKITFTGTITKIEWASSTDLFDKIWDNRSTYIYS